MSNSDTDVCTPKQGSAEDFAQIVERDRLWAAAHPETASGQWGTTRENGW